MSPLTIIYLASYSIQIPQNRERQCCGIFLPFNSSNNDATNLSAASGFIFPDHHSQNRQQRRRQQQSFLKTSSHPWNPNLFSASSKLENVMCVKWGGGQYNYQKHQSQTFTFGGTHCGSTTSGNRVSSVFIS